VWSALSGTQRPFRRLREYLEKKSPAIEFKNEGEAIKVVQDVFQYLSSLKNVDAMRTLLCTAMEQLHNKDRISIETQVEREEYADFIASDIKNACNRFAGKSNLIRFHPIMANLAMNLYMKMSYKDLIGVAPFCFPTERTVQRDRADVATHQGSDPKVYAKITEMKGFRTEKQQAVHWLYDKIKLKSGISWNSKNDDFRGLCCGTTGSTSDLKDMLAEYLQPTTKEDARSKNKEEPTTTSAIYCNQWLARNHEGTTFMGEFFYNQGGGIDGNELV
jgi:hypothetical protein